MAVWAHRKTGEAWTISISLTSGDLPRVVLLRGATRSVLAEDDGLHRLLIHLGRLRALGHHLLLRSELGIRDWRQWERAVVRPPQGVNVRDDTFGFVASTVIESGMSSAEGLLPQSWRWVAKAIPSHLLAITRTTQ